MRLSNAYIPLSEHNPPFQVIQYDNPFKKKNQRRTGTGMPLILFAV